LFAGGKCRWYWVRYESPIRSGLRSLGLRPASSPRKRHNNGSAGGTDPPRWPWDRFGVGRKAPQTSFDLLVHGGPRCRCTAADESAPAAARPFRNGDFSLWLIGASAICQCRSGLNTSFAAFIVRAYFQVNYALPSRCRHCQATRGRDSTARSLLLTGFAPATPPDGRPQPSAENEDYFARPRSAASANSWYQPFTSSSKS